MECVLMTGTDRLRKQADEVPHAESRSNQYARHPNEAICRAYCIRIMLQVESGFSTGRMAELAYAPPVVWWSRLESPHFEHHPASLPVMRAARAVPGMGRCGSVRSARAPRNLLAAAGWLARSGCDADGCRALCQPGRPDRPCAARTGGDTCGVARHPGRGGAAVFRHRSQLAHAHRAIEFHPEPGVVQFGRDRPHAQSLWPQPQPGLCAGRLRRTSRPHRCPALSAHGQSADRQPHPAGYRRRSGGRLFCLAGRACAGHRPDPAGNRPARQPRRGRRQAAAISARFEAERARAARWPSLSLAANTGRTLFLDSDRSPSTTYSVGVNVTMPLFDGGRLAAQARDAERLQADAEAQRSQVALAVADAYYDVRQAQAQREGVGAQFDSASESAQAAEARYKPGVGSLLEWLTAQADLARARQAQAQADSDWLAALSRLNHALGRLPATSPASLP